MAEKIEINGQLHINTEEAAKRLGVTSKRVLEFIAQERIEAVYLNGYFIPETELKKVQKRKPGRPAKKTQASKDE
jgi:hypothetical protein